MWVDRILHEIKKSDNGKYVALSQRWTDPDFPAYPCNLQARHTGIDYESLPKRFQNAVIATRELGIPFLWIDSIYIIQRHRDRTPECLRPDQCLDSKDWDVECGKMEEYFSSAYCTIAATSATNLEDDKEDKGFLERRSHACWITVLDASQTLSHDIDPIDNFRRDVEEADLNKRGLVLQERALSRRTIHFTSTQAY